MRRLAVLLALFGLLVLAGCGAHASSPPGALAPTALLSPTPLPPSATPTASPSPTVSPSPTLSPTPTATPSPRRILPPPHGYLYHGVYPGGRTGEEDDLTLQDLRSYERAAGKAAAWVYFSHNWYRGRSFPRKTAEWIWKAGSVPYIRLMLRSSPEEDVADPLFTLAAINSGKFDADLRRWCEGARDFGFPLLVEYGTEVNGSWFPWNGAWNGGGRTDGYGDPKFPDGPERFRDAYRRIIGICRAVGADNITWVFHLNDDDYPAAPWNRFENYYPGDAWIDWIGISVYGALTPFDEECDDFQAALDAVYPRVVKMVDADKPIFVAEFGVAANNPLCNQERWAERALRSLTSFRWPRIIGFSWWNEYWQNDDDPAHDTTMRLQDNPALAAVFRKFVGANPRVLGRARFYPER